MNRGSQGLRPKANWAVRNSSGAPRMEDTPGGMGMVLGSANTRISAPIARSRRAVAKSPIEIRARLSSLAICVRMSDREGPNPAV